MSIGYAHNSTLHIDTFTPYLRLGTRLFDPSGKNACYGYKSLSREEMKKYIMQGSTKEEIVDMLLDFVDNGDDYQNATA